MQQNNQLSQNIEREWAKLEAALADLNEQQLTQICDERGWSIKDHLAHIAHWGEVLLLMFMDIPFEETMRIPFGKHPDMDDINEAMRMQWVDFSAGAILSRLRRVHRQLMVKILLLSEEDLQTPVKSFFANLWTPEYEQRNLVDMIPEYTFAHYRDHAAYIDQMKASAS